MNVYLVGLRGSGKSTVGKILANLIDFDFMDQDELTVKQAGKPIAQIFSEDGEPEFRRIESQTLRQLASRDKCIVATGGGVVLSMDNRNLLRETGLVVHLDGPVEIFAQRIEADTASRESRPPLTSIQDAVEEMQQVALERAHLYEAVRHVWLSAGDSPEELAGKIALILKERSIL